MGSGETILKGSTGAEYERENPTALHTLFWKGGLISRGEEGTAASKKDWRVLLVRGPHTTLRGLRMREV